MKLHDTIACLGEKDLQRTLTDIEIAGFEAERFGAYGLRITSVPEQEYLVQAASQHGMQRSYCSTLEEAEELAEEMARNYEFVEILKGYPGEWESVSRNW